MKTRIAVVVLVLACVGLGIGLVSIKKQADKQKVEDADRFVTSSNQWSDKLQEQKQFAATLEKDLDVQKKSFVDLTNDYAQVSANLTQAKASLETSQEEIKKRDAKIADLESQNQALDRKA